MRHKSLNKYKSKIDIEETGCNFLEDEGNVRDSLDDLVYHYSQAESIPFFFPRP